MLYRKLNNENGACSYIIIEEYAEYIRTLGKKTIQLAFAKGNLQSEAFWQKNGFVRTGKEVQNDGYIAVCMKREL